MTATRPIGVVIDLLLRASVRHCGLRGAERVSERSCIMCTANIMYSVFYIGYGAPIMMMMIRMMIMMTTAMTMKERKKLMTMVALVTTAVWCAPARAPAW